VKIFQIRVDSVDDLVLAENMHDAVEKHMAWIIKENSEHLDCDEDWYQDILEQVVCIGELKEGPEPAAGETI